MATLPTFIRHPNWAKTRDYTTLLGAEVANRWLPVSELGVTATEREIEVVHIEKNCFVAVCKDPNKLMPIATCTNLQFLHKKGKHVLPDWADYICVDFVDGNPPSSETINAPESP